MRLRIYLIKVFLLLQLINCNGQDKQNETHGKTENDFGLTNNFNNQDKFYFDNDEKLIFSSSLIKNTGKFTIYYIPVSEENINYSKKFEDDNKIKPLYDELNSVYYYSNQDQFKINNILKEKLKSQAGYKIIGSYIPDNYIDIENSDDFSINYPYLIKYYQKTEGKWKFLLEKEITNVEEDQNFNSKQGLSKILNKNIFSEPNVGEKQDFKNNKENSLNLLLETWKKTGYQIDKEKSADINKDGINDKIYVLYKENDANLTVNVIFIDKNSQVLKIFRNKNILHSFSGNSLAEGLRNIVVKNNYFTFEDNVSGGNPVQNVFTTFMYNKNNDEIFLHKYGVETVYPDGVEEKDLDKTYSIKDFGVINFEDFNTETINDLIHKK